MARTYLPVETVNKIENFCALTKGYANELSKIPVINSPYRISDVVPDFRMMEWNLSKISSYGDSTVVSFKMFPLYAVNHVKLYSVFEIHRGLKGQTIQSKISILNRLFKTIAGIHPDISDIGDISLNDLVESETRNTEGKIIAEFFYLITDIGVATLSFDIADYENELQRRRKAVSYQLIPKVLFKRILTVTAEVMNNVNAPVDDRIMACTIRVFTQIAPRISEFLHFKINQIAYHYVPGHGNICYLTYHVTKTESNSETRPVEVPLNPIAEEAYIRLIDLRKNVFCHDTSEILFSYCKDKKLPITYGTFMERYCNFFFKYLNAEIHESYENFDGIKLKGCQVSIPHLHSFRVNVVTELYSNRVGLDYIRRRMAHLSALSENTYTRPSLFSSGESEYIDKCIDKEKERLNTGKPDMESNLRQLRNFLNNSSPKVIKTSSSELKKLLSTDQYNPVREGICTKGLGTSKAFMNPESSVSDELRDGYEHLHLSLDEFRRMRDDFSSMIHGRRFSELDLKKRELKRFSNNIYEVLARLKKECEAVGTENFLFDHPELEDIVINISRLMGELSKWR